MNIYVFAFEDHIEYYKFAVAAESISQARAKIVDFHPEMESRIAACPVSVKSIDAVIEVYGYDAGFAIYEPKLNAGVER